MAAVYRCDLLDASARTIGTRLFRGTDDEAAIEFAVTLSEAAPESCGIELWQGDRLVLRHDLRGGEPDRR